MGEFSKRPCRRQSHGQHPAERRELVEPGRIVSAAVLRQQPARVPQLHQSQRSQRGQRPFCAERGQQREHEIKQCKHRQRPGHAVELAGQVGRAVELLGQRQVGNQIQRQRLAPPTPRHGQHQTEQQADVVGGQQPQGAAAVEFRRADARPRLVPHSRVGPGQEQAERRQHDQQVHADAARPQPVCRGCAAVPALLPDVERADGPGRQHPHKVRSRRAVCVDGRRGAV